MNPNTKKSLFNTSWCKYVTSVLFITFLSATILMTYFQDPRELYWAIGWQIEQTPPPVTIEKFFSCVQKGTHVFIHSKKLYGSDHATRILVDFYGYIQRILGKQICGDILKLNNGYLIGYNYTVIEGPIYYEVANNINLVNKINRINKLSEVTQSYDTSLLYISFPCKIHKRDSQLPFHSNKINTFMDYFCTLFEDRISLDNKVQLYDARNLYLNNSKEHYRLFFKNDHHWQPEYAFYVFLDILKYFDKSIFNIPEEVLNSQNYEFVSFPFTVSSHDGIGSYERRTGQLYVTDKDVVYFPIPKYPVLFEVSVPSDNYYKKCNFRESICLQRNQHLRTIINPNQSRGKILLIKDSFALPLFSYLGLISHQVDMIDLRYYDGSIFDYIRNNRPDLVIIAYTPGMFHYETSIMFEFDKRNDKSTQ